MLLTVTDEMSDPVLTSVMGVALGERMWMGPRDYPDVEAWAERSIVEIRDGRKFIMVAFRRRNVIGSIIFQHHKTIPGVLEIRRISIQPGEQGRGVAAFLLRCVEMRGLEELGCTTVWVDTKARNTAMCRFLEARGYELIGLFDLYGLGAGCDAVYSKQIRAARRGP